MVGKAKPDPAPRKEPKAPAPAVVDRCRCINPTCGAFLKPTWSICPACHADQSDPRHARTKAPAGKSSVPGPEQEKVTPPARGPARRRSRLHPLNILFGVDDE